ncbi:FAD-binding oxidoreductase [Candidiatus Paracoxiella cheracis]|uniref:FAD-dependent oxidoreductase n=1 Tax=Candidiatus Paracoxiella cheracis TaxID=3405120 RepID=UPI003BF51D0A
MVIAAFDRQQAYQQKKERLSAQIKQKTQHSGENITLRKKTSNLFRHRRSRSNRIDVRAFNQVISVDGDNLIAEVEGMTTYEALVAETLKYGCMPTVVPELKSITIGGALSGLGIESSCFRYGLVHETIIQYDILLPDGRVVDCRPDNEYSDLYYSIPNSYGTLGYALKVTVKLVPVKKYLRLNFHHFENPHDFFVCTKEICLENRLNGSVSFVDGVIFQRDHQVLVVGEMVDEVPKANNYKFMKIYYKAVESKEQDYLTIEDYIWRWDPDWFWCSRVFYMQNPIMRFLLGKWALRSTVYSKIMRFAKRNRVIQWLAKKYEPSKESVIQDVVIPIENAPDYLEFFHDNIGIKPVWICPTYRIDGNADYRLFTMRANQLYVNFGFWDMIPSNKAPGYYNRLIEKKVVALGGNKSLYSNAYYTPEEFWTIYDKPHYESLKKKYDPENYLNSLYNKCVEKS